MNRDERKTKGVFMNGIWLTAFVEAVMYALKDYVPAGGRVHFEMSIDNAYNEKDGWHLTLRDGDAGSRHIRFDAVMPEKKAMLSAPAASPPVKA